MKDYPETHQKGYLSVESTTESGECNDFGIQIAEDGRVWICVDGMALLRFRPIMKEKAIKESGEIIRKDFKSLTLKERRDTIKKLKEFQKKEDKNAN